MNSVFGGKLTGGIFAIIGAIIAVIMVGLMTAPFGTLVAYFDPAAQDASDGSRFVRVYVGISGDDDPSGHEINTDTNVTGGSGWKLAEGTSDAAKFEIVAADSTEVGFTATQDLSAKNFYNEQGKPVTVTGTLVASVGTGTLGSSWKWKSPPQAFSQLNFLNSILVTLLALVATIGLIMKTKNAYDAFQRGGKSDLAPVVLREVGTLVLAVVGVYMAPTLLNILANTAYVYTSGQFDFSFVSTILKIVFAVVPTMLIVGIMGLVSGAQVQDTSLKAAGRVMPRFGRRRAPAYSAGM